jgi:hypothetical protein
VDVEICAADTASVNAEKNFVGLDFWNSNIPVFEFTRGVVNNGFHKEINERAAFWWTNRGKTCGRVWCENKQSQPIFKKFFPILA